jgi:hypothetical protein
MLIATLYLPVLVMERERERGERVLHNRIYVGHVDRARTKRLKLVIVHYGPGCYN